MKRIFKFGLTAGLLLSAMSFTSCKDKYNEPSSESVNKFDGTRLTSLNDIQVSYDESGRVESLETSYGQTLEFDYSKGTITCDWGGGDVEVINVNFTKDGYISELTSKITEEEPGEYKYSGSGKSKFSYNNKHLIKIEDEWNETETYPGSKEKYYEIYKSQSIFNWKNDNIINIRNVGSEEYDGEIERWENQYSIEYAERDNIFKQFPISLSYELDLDTGISTDLMGVLAAVGLFGKGPALLPNYVNYSYDNKSNGSYSIFFDLNDNGSIKKETGRYSYIYRYSEMTRTDFSNDPTVKRFNIKKFFNRKRHLKK